MAQRLDQLQQEPPKGLESCGRMRTMSAVKLQVVRGTDHGTESVDFRGDKFIGHDQGDEHRTVLEIDPADGVLVEAIVDGLGAKLNTLFQAFTESQPDAVEPIADALGLNGDGKPFLRLGVFDS